MRTQPLSLRALFLATSPKSNSSTLALAAAKRAIRDNPVQSIPPSIQDRHGRNKKYRDEQEEGYLYSHDFPENISGQSYLEKDLLNSMCRKTPFRGTNRGKTEPLENPSCSGKKAKNDFPSLPIHSGKQWQGLLNLFVKYNKNYSIKLFP